MLLSLINPFSLLRFVGPLVTLAGILAFAFLMFTGRINLGEVASELSSMAAVDSSGDSAGEAFELSNVSKPDETVFVATFNAGKIDPEAKDLLNQAQSIAVLFAHFDIVAIQSLRLGHTDPFGDVLRLLNQGQEGRYQMTTSRLLGPPGRLEQYAFIFDTHRVRLDTNRVYVVEDPLDRLQYEPFVAHFAAFQSANLNRPPFTFSVVNSHLDAQGDSQRFMSEQRVLVDVIANVAQWESTRFGEDDIMIVGALDGARTELLAFATFPSLTTLGPNESTLVNENREVDHIIIDRAATLEWTSQSGVIHYERDFGFSKATIQSLTDHRMVWARFSAYEVPSQRDSGFPNPVLGQQALGQQTNAF